MRASLGSKEHFQREVDAGLKKDASLQLENEGAGDPTPRIAQLPSKTFAWTLKFQHSPLNSLLSLPIWKFSSLNVSKSWDSGGRFPIMKWSPVFLLWQALSSTCPRAEITLSSPWLLSQGVIVSYGKHILLLNLTNETKRCVISFPLFSQAKWASSLKSRAVPANRLLYKRGNRSVNL